jgi:hypothetical protein
MATKVKRNQALAARFATLGEKDAGLYDYCASLLQGAPQSFGSEHSGSA